MKFINGSIKNKIIFWMLISLTVSSLTILITTSQKISKAYVDLTRQQLELFSNNIFIQLRMEMAKGNTKELSTILEKAKTIENVIDVRLIKSERLLKFSKSNQQFTKEKNILEVFHKKIESINEEQVGDKNYVKLLTPIVVTDECLKCHTNQVNGDVIAVMDVVFSVDDINNNAQEIIWNIIYTSLFFGVLTIFVLLFIIQRATEPIEGLKYGFKRLLNSNNFTNNVKLTIRTNDEIGDVALLFNEYIDKLTLEFKTSAEKFAQNIMDTQVDLVVTTDENRQLLNVNQAFLHFFHVDNLKQFIKEYSDDIAFTFKEIDMEGFISPVVDGFFWDVYVKNYQNKIHKVVLQNKHNEATFTVSTNSIVFDGKVFTTSVFTNIDELETIRKEIEESHKKLKILFDNANEGFLYFDRNMLIGGEYSLKAQEIFGVTIEQKYITDLLFEDLEERIFVQDTLVGILDTTKEKQEILISLLKDEFSIRNNFIKVQYKVIGKDTFMLILTDITQNKQLNEKIKDEQQIYKMVVTVITFFEQFNEVKNDFINFTNNIEKYKTLEMLPTLRREIHTYKGLFAQFELLNSVKKLHLFESSIDYSLKIGEISEDIIYLSSKSLYSWFETDLNLINSIFRQNIFIHPTSIRIEKSRIENIYKNIYKYQNIEAIKKEIEKLTYHNIKDTFYAYGQLIRTLSKRFEKPMKELVLECDDIYLSDIYKPFLNALVHIFRNSLDHGIECEEERYLFEKEVEGTISCEVYIVKSLLKINYKDDGKGLDINAIKRKILEKNLLNEVELNQLNEEDILMYIFEDNFSTKEVITDISGRGVGLASLKNEVDILGGTIEIKSKTNIGVEFIFTLPFVE